MPTLLEKNKIVPKKWMNKTFINDLHILFSTFLTLLHLQNELLVAISKCLAH